MPAPGEGDKLNFERDIKPLFRTKDRDSMLPAFDHTTTRMSSIMPTPSSAPCVAGRCRATARGRTPIQASPELTASERTAVLGGTATTLIPRVTTLRAQTQARAS
jgi:hypothetical protein